MENTAKQLLKPAFGYIRVSGESQVKEDGPVRQRKAIQDFAKAHGFRIVKWFVEEAVSGTVESKDRPAFSEMLAALMGNGTRTVLIEKLDRIAREVYVQEGTIRLLKEKGFELISVSEPDLNSDDMYRVAMRQMMGVFAELDRKSIVYKLRAARQRKRVRDGWCEGRKPFGSRAGEDAVIARMKELRATGATWDSIAGTLNAEGLKPRKGKAWYATSVRRIVVAQ
jgi:DNA invertase Pin-like site-specific DNA recombinase